MVTVETPVKDDLEESGEEQTKTDDANKDMEIKSQDVRVAMPVTTEPLNKGQPIKEKTKTDIETSDEKAKFMTDEEFQELKKHFMVAFNNVFNKDKNTEEPNEDDNNDNIEAAKNWAKKQKQSLL